MKKIHLIGNAHLDPVWMWQWQEGFAEVKATFKSALDRMEEFEDFKFTSACSAYYMWIEKSDPDMFAQIQKRVKEGRWNIVGGWFIQPDCNMPSGEAFARHALISQRYFYEKFGVTSHTGYNVDSFGHNGNLPQILKNSGMDNYVFMRPMPQEKELPAHLFDWESMDGSRVRTYRIPEFYNIDMTRPEVFSKIMDMPENNDMMAFYGVGNHGGGATIELLDWMHKNLSEDYIYSTPDEYFEAVKNEDVPVVCDDLQFHAKGCYSAYSKIKKDNRKAENMLFQTEAFSVLSNQLVDTAYPEKELERAWHNLLFNQFHDILCGCSVSEAYDDAGIQLGETMSVASRNSNFAIQQISWNIDTMDGKELKAYKTSFPPTAIWRNEENIGTPVVVFNPLAYPVETVVSVREVPKYITDNDGNVIPLQITRDSKMLGNPFSCEKEKTVFTAYVPAMGYSVYRMYFESEAESPETDVCAKDNVLENSKIKVVFDKSKGEISEIIDKNSGENLLKSASGVVLMDEEHCDTWAHDIKEFKKVSSVCESGSIHIIENGPVRATMRTEQKIGNSYIIRDYSIASESDEIVVNTQLDFHEKHKMMKFTMPVNARNPESICEIPFGFIQRETDGAEQVSGSWIGICGDDAGIGLATDSKYSFDAENNALSLTVARGAVFADHFGQKDRDEFCEYMDQGIQKFTYSIFPFTGAANAAKRAQKLNNQPTAIVETFHKGKLGMSFSGVEISQDNIVVTALKKHEDSNGWVLRCYEADNRDTNTKIRVFDTEFAAEFKHNEIKTFIIENGKARETDFIEK